MKAMRMHRYGDPSVITQDDIPPPVPGPGEVLLKVAATSFNPSEAGLRRGLLRGVFDVDLPYTLGSDVAGTVVIGSVSEGSEGSEGSDRDRRQRGGGGRDSERRLGTGDRAHEQGGGDGGREREQRLGTGDRAHEQGGGDGGREREQRLGTGDRGLGQRGSGHGGRDGADGWAVGERVIGLLDGGAAAEYAVAPASALVAAPVTISAARAATLPIAGLTAWQAVVEHARPVAGMRVLVNGAGAVGRFAVPLVRRSGAYTIVALSPRAAEGMRRLGADEVVVRDELGRVRPVDVVINLVPADLGPLAALVRPGGLLVSATTPVDGLAVRAVHFIARPSRDQLAELVRLVDAGELPVEVAAERPMAELADVHRDAEEGRLPGKTVLTSSGFH